MVGSGCLALVESNLVRNSLNFLSSETRIYIISGKVFPFPLLEPMRLPILAKLVNTCSSTASLQWSRVGPGGPTSTSSPPLHGLRRDSKTLKHRELINNEGTREGTQSVSETHDCLNHSNVKPRLTNFQGFLKAPVPCPKVMKLRERDGERERRRDLLHSSKHTKSPEIVCTLQGFEFGFI